MALKMICGFDHCPATTADSVGEFTFTGSGSSTVSATAARYGANGFLSSPSTSAGSYAEFTIGGTEDDVFVGAAFQFRSLPSGAGIGGARGLFSFMEAGTKHCDLRISNGGQLMFSRNGTQLGSTGATILSTTTWYYIEVHLHIHDSAGSYEVRINEVVENMGTTTSLDTRNGGTGYVDRVRLGNDIQSTPTIWMDDFYACDDQGGLNNDYLGDIAVRTLVPTGAGNTTEMTPSAGSNYQCVDEVPASTSDYVSETTTGEKDTYIMADLPTLASSVKGVKTLLWAAKQDAGARTMRHVIRQGGTDYESGSMSLADSYGYSSQIWETDPDTSAAWTVGGPDSIEFGPKLQS